MLLTVCRMNLIRSLATSIHPRIPNSTMSLASFNKKCLKTLDFRSDTLTRPTQEMLEAMKNASSGDDVYEVIKASTLTCRKTKVPPIWNPESLN